MGDGGDGGGETKGDSGAAGQLRPEVAPTSGAAVVAVVAGAVAEPNLATKDAHLPLRHLPPPHPLLRLEKAKRGNVGNGRSTTGAACLWTLPDQIALEKALRQYPPSTVGGTSTSAVIKKRRTRWDNISRQVRGKSSRECVERCRHVRAWEQALAREAEEKKKKKKKTKTAAAARSSSSSTAKWAAEQQVALDAALLKYPAR